MSDVVQFPGAAKAAPEAKDRIWTCALCGCQTFYLYEDGHTECGICGHHGYDASGGWAEQVKPSADFNNEMPKRANAPYGTADLARAAVLKAVDDQACALTVIWPTGRIKVWSVFNHRTNQDQKDWLHIAMRNAASLALGEPDSLDEMPE